MTKTPTSLQNFYHHQWQNIVEYHPLPKFGSLCHSSGNKKKVNCYFFMLPKITSRLIITIKISKPGKLSRSIKLFLKTRFYFFRYFNLYCAFYLLLLFLDFFQVFFSLLTKHLMFCVVSFIFPL